MRPLRAKLHFTFVALTSGTVALSAIATYFVGAASLRQSLDNAILQIAKTELASATDTGGVHVHEKGGETLSVQGVPGYEKYVWVEDDSNRVVARTSNLAESPQIEGASELVRRARVGQTMFGDIRIRGQQVRAVFYPFRDVPGRSLVGVVGVPTTVVSRVMASVGWVEILIGFACVAVSWFFASVFANALGRPLARLASRVESASLEEGTAIEPVGGPFTEVVVLSRAFSRLVERVRKMLDERAKTISAQRRFASDASHELRTPVSNIQGTIEVALRRDRTSVEYRDALAVSLGECRRMGRLVEDLLLLAKTDEGMFEVNPRPADISEILRLAVRGAEHRKPPAVRLETTLPRTLHASVDADRLAQAVDNLLSNAMTHANSVVTVGAAEDGEHLVIRIANDGPSLTVHEAEAIFDRFSRLDYARSRQSGGSGLGLAVVRAIAEGHGGTVRAATLGGWTSFVLSLPVGPRASPT